MVIFMLYDPSWVASPLFFVKLPFDIKVADGNLFFSGHLYQYIRNAQAALFVNARHYRFFDL
jgi:hypothetical protein